MVKTNPLHIKARRNATVKEEESNEQESSRAPNRSNDQESQCVPDITYIQDIPCAPNQKRIVTRQRRRTIDWEGVVAVDEDEMEEVTGADEMQKKPSSPPAARPMLIRAKSIPFHKKRAAQGLARQATVIADYGLDTTDLTKVDNIRVIANFRPKNMKEEAEERAKHMEDLPCAYFNDRIEICQAKRKNEPHKFCLDAVLPPHDTEQSDVYEVVGKPMLAAAVQGFNTTIFAYGQTGSGKTYCMFGPDNAKPEEVGLVPRVTEQLFSNLNAKVMNQKLEWSEVTVEFLQVYQGEIMDLLLNTKQREQRKRKKGAFRINLHPKTKKNYVKDLQVKKVDTADQVDRWLQEAMKNRIVRGHALNDVSSRSHMIMTFRINQYSHTGLKIQSQLNFVDLAGSERMSKAKLADKTAKRECIAINSSLTALTSVIQQILRNETPTYRASKLTELLAESLGGNCKTTLVVAASPSVFNRDETISTLRFAQQAKKVKTKGKRNQEQSKSQLKTEIAKLKQRAAVLSAEKVHLEAQLIEAEAHRDNTTKQQAEQDYSHLLKEIEGLKTKIQELTEDLSQHKEVLKQRDATIFSLQMELSTTMQQSVEAHEKDVLQIEELTKSETELKEMLRKLEEESANQRQQVTDQLAVHSATAKYTAQICSLCESQILGDMNFKKKEEEVQPAGEECTVDKMCEQCEELLKQKDGTISSLEAELTTAKNRIQQAEETHSMHLHRIEELRKERMKPQICVLCESQVRSGVGLPVEEVVVEDSFGQKEVYAVTQKENKKTAVDMNGNLFLRLTDESLINITTNAEDVLSRWKKMNKTKELEKGPLSDSSSQLNQLVACFNIAMGSIKHLQQKLDKLDEQQRQVQSSKPKKFSLVNTSRSLVEEQERKQNSEKPGRQAGANGEDIRMMQNSVAGLTNSRVHVPMNPSEMNISYE